MAQEVLTHLKEHPDAWTRVDTILEFSQNMNTKVSQVPTYSGGGSWFLYFEEDLISYHTLHRITIWFYFPSKQIDCPVLANAHFLSVMGLLSIMSENRFLCTHVRSHFPTPLLTVLSWSSKVKVGVWGSSVDSEIPQYLRLYSSQRCSDWLFEVRIYKALDPCDPSSEPWIFILISMRKAEDPWSVEFLESFNRISALINSTHLFTF